MRRIAHIVSSAALVLVAAACGDDGSGGGAAGLCAGVDTAELSDIWGDVEANEVGGTCSILVADGEALSLTRAEAEGEAGVAELEAELIGGDTEDTDLGDEALAFTGSSSGDGYIVRVGDVVFKLSAVGLPEGQLEATASSIADNL